MSEPWERMVDTIKYGRRESHRAYQAFTIYRDLGPAGTIDHRLVQQAIAKALNA